MPGFLRKTRRALLQRAPRLRSFGLAALDTAARPILTWFKLDAPSSSAPAGAIEQKAADFNAAAEDYYAHADRAHLLNKPFSEPDLFARRLIDLGVLVDGLRLRPGDVVLELGAGACWVSHLLNKFGCRTIAVDVSPTALAIGRELFERDPRTNWTLAPEFLPYDGRRLPAADASADAVVLYDTFHHLPNPQALLREMRRVLRPDGIAAMSEPGRGHSASASTVVEAGAHGVLERELVLEELADQAIAAGFAAARVLIANRPPFAEVDAREMRGFSGGRGFARYWRDLAASLDGHHYLLLYAGDPAPTTRRPKGLKAIVEAPSLAGVLTVQAGQQGVIELRIRNAGDTRWLHAEGSGWTRLGAHLYRASEPLELVDFDWIRVSLPHDVKPDDVLTVRVTLPAITTPGHYRVSFDLVVEGMTWFADRDSQPLFKTVEISGG
jgi:SAM-dependent methyltransferase